jgi:hypothetical protein
MRYLDVRYLQSRPAASDVKVATRLKKPNSENKREKK